MEVNSCNNSDGNTINQDELILQQQRQIEKEISESIALVGELEPITSLQNEYTSDEVYCLKIKDLSAKYKSVRRTRPDGNCFFRAFSYAYLERLITDKEKFANFVVLAKQSKEKLVELGFPQFTLEDFHDTFMEVLRKLQTEEISESHSELHKLFNEQGYSDYVVVYLRLLTSGQLQEGAEFYQNFIDGDRTIAEFCHQEVEPMYKESDHIHIIAICTALKSGVRVEYMDRGDGGQVIAHDFPDGIKPSVHLLYRPGHYDILYPI
ncbi:ubiquitin thioesterase otubain-like [Ctenocephalides felis]|uniref:ubiquitin thioesterase otubain-like n=1 Tax=Ctenocephalides felis TaxID=7515 RepID=UPI000E6E58D1|nr:ubiquitin thioesterase otubain-like [Ctenocephalides felis]XP_026463500.1 ubiquitin thioesterase otubain-like [Ctenocephalides felis]XP_026463501.1 ubiquitin thioesterase otubain-like [Ctenocephalides felis]